MRRVLEVDMNRADVSVVTHGANPETLAVPSPCSAAMLWPRGKTAVGSRQAIAKARRAKSRTASASGANTPAATPPWTAIEPEPRYSQGQLAQLEREGRALRKRDGTYGWGCADRRDLLNCIAAFKRGEAGSEAAAVKAFLKRRGHPPGSRTRAARRLAKQSGAENDRW